VLTWRRKGVGAKRETGTTSSSTEEERRTVYLCRIFLVVVLV
jgi:hypothetical protein